MKFLIIFVCVFVYTNASLSQGLIDEMKSKIQELGMQCVESEKPTDADVEAFMNRQPPATHAGKCVVYCVTEKLNLIHSDGTFGQGNVEWINKVKAEDPDTYAKIHDLYELCTEQAKAEEDVCEKATQFITCAKEESKKRGMDEYY